MKGSQNLIQLTRFGAFNHFLVREDDGFTLVDTNMSGSATMIVKAAEKYNAPIRRILLTHADPDHIGSLDALHALLPDTEVIIGRREMEARIEAKRLLFATQPTRLLEPGERVGSLEAIFSPGHSAGHLAFLDERDGTLIAGDAYGTIFKTIVAGMLVPLFPFSAFVTEDKLMALESARMLRDLRPSRLAVGHGRTLEQPGAAMTRAIQEAERGFSRSLLTQG